MTALPAQRRRWPMQGYGLLVAVLLATATLRDRFDDWVAATALPPFGLATSVEVQARDGRLLRAFTVADGRWRLALPADGADPGFLRMLVAYEDRRFASHAGVDPLAMLRALGQAARHGRVLSGGSTLTMQTARLLEGGTTGAWPGKLRQIRLALALERRLDKTAILNLYLHLAPYGGNIEGLRAASLGWFGKEPRRLTVAESALLVALPQAPESRRPDRAPAAARAARDRVLLRLAAQGALSEEAVRAALREPVPQSRRAVPALAPHLAERLRRGAPLVARHRLTLDADLQASLERLAAETVARLGERVSAAIVLADLGTGAVRATVGSAGYAADPREGFIDMTQALRSPGSALKPLVYALAMDEGLIHPETLIEDKPMAFGTYRPQNFDGVFRGTVSIRQALQLSLNIPVLELTQALGPARLLAVLRRSGARPALAGPQPGLAVALGGLGISLQDLVQVYAGIASGGVARPLYLDADNPPAAAGTRLLSEVAAWQVGDILSGRPGPDGQPGGRIAWKTGTSYGHRDAWAVGYDGRHVAGVWIGRPDGAAMPGAFGGELAAPVLFQALARAAAGIPAPLPPPPSATLLLDNARLPQPLRRFRARDAAFAAAAGGPELAFPPDGAEVETAGNGLVVKVREGTPPFTWMADGAPVVVGESARELRLPLTGLGFVRLSVIDALGRAASGTVRLR